MGRDYVDIKTKRSRNAAIEAERTAQGQNVTSNFNWGVTGIHHVVCKCGQTFDSKVYLSFSRAQAITQTACPKCGLKNNSTSTTKA